MAATVDLAGRVAIVTGGGRGIGRAIANGLALAGANVIVTSAREPAESRGVAAAIEHHTGRHCAVALEADVTREDDCRRTVETAFARFGGMHILVNNAGRGMRFVSDDFMSRPLKFWETDASVWRTIVETNVNGPFLMARVVVPHMLRQRWGRIVNISINHETMDRAGFSPYGPSKAALEAATVVWAHDLAGTGVTVNELLPGGITDTGMVPATASEAIRRVMLDPAIMIPPLLWLCSDAADQVSGGRFVAKNWDPALAPEEAARRAREPSQWE